MLSHLFFHVLDLALLSLFLWGAVALFALVSVFRNGDILEKKDPGSEISVLKTETSKVNKF